MRNTPSAVRTGVPQSTHTHNTQHSCGADAPRISECCCWLGCVRASARWLRCLWLPMTWHRPPLTSISLPPPQSHAPPLQLGTKSVKRAGALILARWWRCRQTSGRRSARAADSKASGSPPRAAGCWATLSKQEATETARRSDRHGRSTAAFQPSLRVVSHEKQPAPRAGDSAAASLLWACAVALTCTRGAGRRVRSGWNRGTGASMQRG